MNKTDKKCIRQIIRSISKVDTADCRKEDGDSLDLDKFNRHPDIILKINELKQYGVNREWLRNNGYILAALILQI